MQPTGLSSTLTLGAITRGRIAKGGYIVSYSGNPPRGARLWLGLPGLDNAVEVTGRPPRDLLDDTNLPRFLAAIGNQRWWGSRGQCRLIATQGPSTVDQSNLVEFDCPVRPLVCRPRLQSPTLGLSQQELMSLTYAAEDSRGSFGRFLQVPAIDGCHYFRNGKDGMFETDPAKRGLVCTTYVGAVWGLAATSGGPMTRPGMEIAEWSGAPFLCQDVGMRSKPLDEVRSYLQKNRRGTFLVGSKGHVVLVVHGTVHEFNVGPRNGYNCTPVGSWRTADRSPGPWSVGKPQMQF